MPYANREEQLAYQRSWNKKYYRRHKLKERNRIQKRKQEIADWFAEYKSSLKCERCGEKDVVCLDFHHRDPNTKDFNLGLIGSWGWGRERIEKEMGKCMVVCANCHRKIHAGR